MPLDTSPADGSGAPSSSRLSSPRRGLDGALVSVWGGKDVRLQVLAREEVSEHLLRLQMDLGGLPEREELYPTYWLRLWFTTPAGKGHQRGYTVVDPDPATGSGWIEFYLHPGIASEWARSARPGDRIDATILGSRDPLTPATTGLLMIGDGASYPAIADTLRRRPELPARVLMARGYPDDEEVLRLPDREEAEVTWFDDPEALHEAALDAARTAAPGTCVFVALEGAPTRRLSAQLRRQIGIPKEHLHALAYWKRS